MDQNVIVLSFAEESKAFEALALLKTVATPPTLKLHTAVVVQRDDKGLLTIKDGASDGVVSSIALNGTLIGALVGMLAGPLGILLGGVYGAIFGESIALDRAQDRASVIDQIGAVIPPGATAMVAQIDEASAEAVDGIAKQLDGTVLRRPLAVVQAEVQAQKEAQDVAAQAAVIALRKQRIEKWEHKVDEWKSEARNSIEEIKQKLHKRSK